MSERDKYLTEAMGMCWHEYDVSGYCIHCKGHNVIFYDYSTWRGFGLLWEWAQKQEWWPNFLFREYAYGHNHEEISIEKLRIYTYELLKFINPPRFADAVYEYLRSLNE